MLTVSALISTVRNVDQPCADTLFPWMCTLVFRPCILQNYSTVNDASPTLIFVPASLTFSFSRLHSF